MNETGTLPHPSVAFLLIGAVHELEARLESALGGVGLSLGKFNVLSKLAAAGEPLPLGALADLCSCVKSNITQLVDRLEADSLVERVPDPSDRRTVRAALTPAGRARHAEAVRLVVETEREALSGLTEADRAMLAQLVGRLGAQC